MYCPRCSKEFEIGTGYCRTCGLSLNGVAEIVKGEAANEPEIKTGPNGKLMRIGIGLFVLGTVTGLAIALFKNLGLDPEAAAAKFIFIMLIMAGMLLIGAGIVFPKKRYVKKKYNSASGEDRSTLTTGRLEQLPSAERNVDDIIFPPNSREADSVTEHTTRQLR